MDIMYRCESTTGQRIYRCITGCRRQVTSFTKFGMDRDRADYCDKCAADIPWTGINMYLEFTESRNTYIVYNSASISPAFLPSSICHDFRLCKI